MVSGRRALAAADAPVCESGRTVELTCCSFQTVEELLGLTAGDNTTCVLFADRLANACSERFHDAQVFYAAAAMTKVVLRKEADCMQDRPSQLYLRALPG
jgi:hypothetical protein